MDNKKNNNEYLVEQYQLQRQLGNLELANEYMTQIINKNKPMIHKIVNKNCNNSGNLTQEDKEDMQQEGMIALMNAAKSYDRTQAVFITYAYIRVSYAVKDWMRDNHLISIPVKKQSECKEYIQVFEKYKDEKRGKNPSVNEMARIMRKRQADIVDIKSALNAYKVDSLSSIITSDNTENRLEDIIIGEEDPFKIVDIQIPLESGMEKLRNREREVLEMYYYQGLGIVEIAKKLNVTPQYISKLKKAALHHLAGMKEVEGLNETGGIGA